MNVQPHDWIGSGGAFLVIALIGLGAAATFATIAIRIGKLTESEGEGVLLAFLNVLLAFAGTAVGFNAMPYPTFLFTALAGAVLFPAVATWLFLRRLAPNG